MEPHIIVSETEDFIPRENAYKLRDSPDPQQAHQFAAIPSDSGKIIRWYNHSDFVTAFAGIIALVVGTIGLVDTLEMSGIIKTGGPLESYPHGPFHGDWTTGNTAPLIIFGIANAVAWNCSLRAIFRVASIEAAPILAEGIQQRDLSDMFEMKLPNWRWFYFRYRMWRTTVFAALCVLCYGGSALTYRLAFTEKEEYTFRTMTATTSPFLGCIKDYDISEVPIPGGRIATFEQLIMPTQGSGGIFATASQTFLSQSSLSSPSGWGVQFGWYSLKVPMYAFSQTKASFGWFRTPVLVALTQVTEEAQNTNNRTIEVADHPNCGPMLRACSPYGGFCLWLGLGGGIFNITYSIEPFKPFQSSKIVAGDWKSTETSAHCPIRLNPAVYQEVVQDMADDLSMDVFHATKWQHEEDYLRNQTIHALLVARLHLNISLILDPAPLVSLSLLPPKNESRVECWAQAVQNITTGKNWYPMQISFFPQYEFTSSGLLILWAFLLLFAAWPFRRLLISGSLHQWMALGASIGRDDMYGASSGYASAHSEVLWRLKTTMIGQKVGHIGFEQVPEDGSPGLEKIAYGKRYV